MTDPLVEKVTEMLIDGFQHCDCAIGACPSYMYRTEGKCHCREQAAGVIALIRTEVLEEAAVVAETPIQVECCGRPKVNLRGEEECCGGPDAVWGDPGEIAAAIRALKEKK